MGGGQGHPTNKKFAGATQTVSFVHTLPIMEGGGTGRGTLYFPQFSERVCGRGAERETVRTRRGRYPSKVGRLASNCKWGVGSRAHSPPLHAEGLAGMDATQIRCTCCNPRIGLLLALRTPLAGTFAARR